MTAWGSHRHTRLSGAHAHRVTSSLFHARVLDGRNAVHGSILLLVYLTLSIHLGEELDVLTTGAYSLALVLACAILIIDPVPALLVLLVGFDSNLDVVKTALVLVHN